MKSVRIGVYGVSFLAKFNLAKGNINTSVSNYSEFSISPVIMPMKERRVDHYMKQRVSMCQHCIQKYRYMNYR